MESLLNKYPTLAPAIQLTVERLRHRWRVWWHGPGSPADVSQAGWPKKPDTTDLAPLIQASDSEPQVQGGSSCTQRAIQVALVFCMKLCFNFG
mmetsp:Transcript_99354/g.171015  ORF Transcript_99354/g.171015 Transcript_99354/m.171015 type:complete len:93 (+) Transcript_99354:175-453(+)